VIAQFPFCVPTAGTTLGATNSTALADACGSGGDDDVWYEFTATTAFANVQVQGGAGFDAVLVVYDACGGTQLGCSDGSGITGQETVSLTGLTVGNVYKIRVYSWNTGAARQGNFTICVFNGVDPCSTISTITCGSIASYNETGSGVWTQAACGFGTPGKEKLFQFTTTSAGTYQLNVTSVSGAFGWVDYFYKEASLGCDQAAWNCIGDISGGGFYEFGPLLAGTTYYLLLDGEGTANYNHTFRLICPPANDNCSGTVQLLTVGASCVPTSGTTQGANPSVTQTSLLPAADYPDVWYRFQAIGTAAQITVATSSLLAAGVEVYSGCGAATPSCVDYAQAQGADLSLTATGLTPGIFYYIRVIDLLSGSVGLNFSSYFFTICVTTVPSPGPSCVTPPGAATEEAVSSVTGNENCGLDVNGGCNMLPGTEYFEPISIGQFVQGTIYAECGSRDTDWFEFTTGAQVSPVAFTVTAEFPVTAFILTGTCPATVLAANSTTTDCDQAQATTVLQPNTTYRLAVVPNEFNGIPCSSTRNNYFMQLTLVSPPANDDCVNAQGITCGIAGTCPGNEVVGNTLAALVDPNPAIVTPTCNAGGNISDIWYVFGVGSATEIEVNITLQSATRIGTELYTSCGVLVAASCVDNADALSPLTYAVIPGTTYRLRCYTNYDVENPGTFRLCVQHKPLPPVNDDICGALNLPFIGAPGIGETSANNFYATNSPQPAMCATSSRDMWYKVTVPASGVVTVNTFFGTNQDLVAAIYSSSDNTCTGVLTSIACDDDRGPNNASWLQVNNRPPGSTLFIRVAGFGTFPASVNKGTFKLSATEGLLWTGASDAFFNTISDPDLGVPTNWYCYDGGFYGPGNFDNAAISVMIPLNIATQPIVSGTLNCNSVRAVGNFFNVGGITVQTGSQLNIHGGISSNGLAQPRFQGAGIFRFNSTVATTHNILNNARMFSTVTVAPTSTVAANGRLIFENNSSLFADSPAATYGSVTGNITYRRIGSASNYNYNYWSTPVNAATIASISAPGVTPNTYQWDPTATLDGSYLGLQAGWIAVGPATTMTNARGYIATGAGASSFTGVPNQGDYTASAVTGAGGAYNLIGNPYPAQLNGPLFLSQNSGKLAGGSLYIWDDDGTAGGEATYDIQDYIIYNGTVTVNGFNSGNPFTGSIASGQGFFINSNGPQTINFNRSARFLFGTNSEFFDVMDYARLKVRVVTAEDFGAETALIFPENATEAADIDYDAARLPGNANIAVYSFIEDGQYAIQGLPELTTERIIPLGVINTVPGNATISISQFEYFEPGVFVYLEDLEEGVFHNLNNSSYVYNNTSITEDDAIRFRLHLRAPLAVNATAACAGQASGKMILNNPNSVDVAVSVKNSENVTVASFGPFTGERVVENLLSGAYTVDFSYVNGDNASRQVDISAGSIVAPATFISSATNVPLEDAIIEFQGSAAGASSFEWNFGDGTIITNDLNPIHAYMTPGVYTVSLTARNGGCESVYTTEITVTALSTGVGSLANTTGFTIYPNPASSNANLMLNLDRKVSQVRIDIHDAAGKLVSSENVNDVRSGSIVELNIDGLANGIYQVTVEGKNFKDVGRLTISK
jgi:PKD repeat protein